MIFVVNHPDLRIERNIKKQLNSKSSPVTYSCYNATQTQNYHQQSPTQLATVGTTVTRPHHHH
jgi:hypothetical protein